MVSKNLLLFLPKENWQEKDTSQVCSYLMAKGKSHIRCHAGSLLISQYHSSWPILILEDVNISFLYFFLSPCKDGLSFCAEVVPSFSHEVVLKIKVFWKWEDILVLCGNKISTKFPLIIFVRKCKSEPPCLYYASYRSFNEWRVRVQKAGLNCRCFGKNCLFEITK